MSLTYLKKDTSNPGMEAKLNNTHRSLSPSNASPEKYFDLSPFYNRKKNPKTFLDSVDDNNLESDAYFSLGCSNVALDRGTDTGVTVNESLVDPKGADDSGVFLDLTDTSGNSFVSPTHTNLCNNVETSYSQRGLKHLPTSSTPIWRPWNTSVDSHKNIVDSDTGKQKIDFHDGPKFPLLVFNQTLQSKQHYSRKRHNVLQSTPSLYYLPPFISELKLRTESYSQDFISSPIIFCHPSSYQAHTLNYNPSQYSYHTGFHHYVPDMSCSSQDTYTAPLRVPTSRDHYMPASSGTNNKCAQISLAATLYPSSTEPLIVSPRAKYTRSSSFQLPHTPGVILNDAPAGSYSVQTSLKHRSHLKKVRKTKNISSLIKKREKPQPFGDFNLLDYPVHFEDTPLKTKYCDKSGKYLMPEIPETSEDRELLKNELLQLFEKSNLPQAPSVMKKHVETLAYFPEMQNLLNGYSLSSLHFDAFGMAFENPKMAQMTEAEFNAILDQMCYLGADQQFHCLVKRTVDNGDVCDHVTKDINKKRRHIKNHYPDKRWICTFCRVQMPDKTDIMRHISTHKEKKPFTCTKCDKKFSQKITLSLHMKNVHKLEAKFGDPTKMFVCRLHGCTFYEKDRESCILHLNSQHSQEEVMEKQKKNKWPFFV